MTVSNWNESSRCTPARIVVPTKVQELIDIVQDVEGHPSPVRAVGELHSLNECFTTDGTIVFMKHFDDIREPEANEHEDGAMTVTVGAGVRMVDLNRFLKSRNLQLEVVPEIGNATAGSVASCGTKDSSLRQGPGQISSTVVKVGMIKADGRNVEVTKASPEDELRFVRSSYGLLGVIHEVTFKVVSRQKITYQYRWRRLDRRTRNGTPMALPDLEADIKGKKADGFLGFMLPFRRRLIVERRTLIARRPVLFLDWVRLKLRNFAWTTGARPFNTPLKLLPFGLRRWLIRAWIAVLDRVFLKWFFLLLGSFAGYRADAMIDFKRPVSSYFDFTFWAFPVDRWQAVVPAFFDFLDDFRRRTGFRPALPVEIYYIRKDSNALLSFCPDTDIFTLDLVNWSDVEPGRWRLLNQEFNEFAARNGARPLLNQTKHLLPLGPEFTARFWNDPEWIKLSDRREREDPRKRFLNPFFEQLLPPPGRIPAPISVPAPPSIPRSAPPSPPPQVPPTPSTP
jgi:hypothetical protein